MKKETEKAKEKRRIVRRNSRWIFLSTVLFIYLIMSLFNFSLAQEVFLVFGRLLLQILPVLAVVFVLLFVSKLFLSPRRVVRVLGGIFGIQGLDFYDYRRNFIGWTNIFMVSLASWFAAKRNERCSNYCFS